MAELSFKEVDIQKFMPSAVPWPHNWQLFLSFSNQAHRNCFGMGALMVLRWPPHWVFGCHFLFSIFRSSGSTVVQVRLLASCAGVSCRQGGNRNY